MFNKTICLNQYELADLLVVVTAVNHVVRFSNRVVNHDDYVIWVSFDEELKDKSIDIGDVIVRLRKN